MNESEVRVLLNQLFPICRSLTGKGVKNTLNILSKISNFDIKKVKSGVKCFDWTVPDEWNINEAYIENMEGNKIVDFNNNNLHVVNYSVPINKIISFNELNNHLHTLPDLPDAIPYRTTYYSKNWGFIENSKTPSAQPTPWGQCK